MCGDPQCPSCGTAQGTYEPEPHQVTEPMDPYDYYRRLQQVQEPLARAQDDAEIARACAKEFKRERDALLRRLEPDAMSADSVRHYASRAQARRLAMNNPDQAVVNYYEVWDVYQEMRDELERVKRELAELRSGRE